MVQNGPKLQKIMKTVEICQGIVGQIFVYLNIFGRIYSFPNLFVDFFLGTFNLDIHSGSISPDKFIRRIICPISMGMNIFKYLFVLKIYNHATLVCLGVYPVLAGGTQI